ncbi:MAG: hypothetical protein GF315_06655 [candidate division Zixibacteria bacterium]|nr:hypothetical protein [candidate division Zixibacteria bacterium]
MVSDKSARMTLGVNSGTSMDSLDIGLFDIGCSGGEYTVSFKNSASFSFSTNLEQQLYSLAGGGDISLRSLLKCDKELSLMMSSSIKEAIGEFGLNVEDIDLIGSHGQTVAHYPDEKTTSQLGDPSIICADTGITTVGDFRRADIGAGGEGAPLSPIMHQHLFAETKPIAVLNIGGIANISYVPSINSNESPFGFDCGPGNMLIDRLCQLYYKRKYDNDGEIARSGKVIKDVVGQLKGDEFINAAPPKSTGREHYGDKFIQKFFPGIYGKEDLICTATELTAFSVSANLKRFLSQCDKIIICGGGALNSYLLERLASYLSGYVIEKSDDYGIPSKMVECAGFALLAAMAVDRVYSDLRKTTGANKPVILGKVCYA